MCDTAKKLASEYRLKDASEFAPSTKYLFESFAHEQLPGAWSEKGKELFVTVFVHDLNPEIDIQCTFECDCEEEKEKDELHEIAYLIVRALGRKNIIIPVVNMFNHRNGNWTNIDIVNSVQNSGDVSFIALRDIEVGEQLYLSKGDSLPVMVADNGFVEQYPRRFNLIARRFNLTGSNEEDLEFELDINDNNEVELEWLSSPPDLEQVNCLRSHHRRLRNLVDVVSQGAEELPRHEKDLITDYYEALVSALEYAHLFTDPEEEDDNDCGGIMADNRRCDDVARKYDTLEEKPDTLDYSAYGFYADYHDTEYDAMFEDKQYPLDEIHSQYQKIEFFQRKDQDPESNKTNTCMSLSGIFHTCTCFRPHYHEMVVHYPASFLNTVKRVLFVGGGDNMILHEVLKYPSIELVVGMELDQQVVRSSFKMFGTQPHFDQDVVQWWFGDGSKSILMLPQEYYGTFDLVVIDLITFVTNSLKVTEELSIFDVASLFLKPEGILIQNEDFNIRNKVDFAQYTVDLEVYNVPMLDQWSFTMGSEAVDFLHQTPKDHGVESIIFKPAADQDHHFDPWGNYRRNIPRVRNPGNELDSLEEKRELLREAQTNMGVMIILEVEDVTIDLDSSTVVKDAISQALKNAGLTETSFAPFVSKDGKNSVFFIVMQEGYITLRIWPEYSYCAFDLKLWSSFDKHDTLQAKLISAVDGHVSSSYRIVTGGMHGHSIMKEPIDLKQKFKSMFIDLKQKFKSKFTDTPIESGNTEDDVVESRATLNNTVDPILRIPAKQSIMDTILLTASSLIQTTLPVITVICADSTSPCKTFDALKMEDTVKRKVVAVFSCVDQSSTNDLSQSMVACERESLINLMESVAVTGRMNGIVIDPAAPRVMGQIMYKILSSTKVRMKLLAEHYVILAPTSDPNTSWRKNILERFRTDIVKFSPAYAGDMFFNSTTSSLNLGIFSSGDDKFYYHLAKVVETSEKETGFIADVRSVKDGIISYIHEPELTIGKDSDYNSYSAYEQWKTQHPLGRQSIFQFGVQTPPSPLSPKERVLVDVDLHFHVKEWDREWYPAQVIKQNDDGTYDIIRDGSKKKKTLDRKLIHKLESFASTLSVGEMVLINNHSRWNQGSVLQIFADDTFKVQINNDDYNDSITSIVHRHDLMPQKESDSSKMLPRISIPMLKKGIQNTLADMGIEEAVNIHVDIGDGCIITISWSQGSIILSWDGWTNVEINLYTDIESSNISKLFDNLFLQRVPILTLFSHDEHPRGIGRVVNFDSKLQSRPHWASHADANVVTS